MKLTRKEAAALGLHIEKAPRKPREGQRTVSQYPADQKLFDALCQSHGLPRPVAEYQFHDERKWRFDYVFDGWLALEKQGGNWQEGRHTNPAALEKEYEKLNHAVICGFSVMFCTPEQIQSGAIFPLIKQALAAREEQS